MKEPFTSESILVFKFRLCPGPLVLHVCVLGVGECGGRGTLVPGAAGSQSSFLCMLQLHDMQFLSVVSEKHLSICLVKQDRTILS